MQSSIEFI